MQIGFPKWVGSDWQRELCTGSRKRGIWMNIFILLAMMCELTAFTGQRRPSMRHWYPRIWIMPIMQALQESWRNPMALIKLLTVAGYGSAWQLAVTVDSGISTLKDLKGKTISYQRGKRSSANVFTENPGRSWIGRRRCEFGKQYNSRGTVQSFCRAVDLELLLPTDRQIPLWNREKPKSFAKGVEADLDTYFEPTVLLGRTEFVEENQEVNVALLKALLKAKDQVVQDPESFYELSQRSGRTLEQVKSVAVEDPKLGYPVSLDDQYIDSLKN